MSDRRMPAQIAEDIADLSDAEIEDLARILYGAPGDADAVLRDALISWSD